MPLMSIGVFLLWSFIMTCGLALFGQQHQATITSRRYAYRSKQRVVTYCRIGYTYQDEGGREFDIAMLEKRAYDFYPPGTTISIRSARVLGHSTSKLTSGAGNKDSVLGLAIGVIIWNGTVLAVFYLWCLRPIIHWWLVRYGEAVMGQITDKNEIFKGKTCGITYVAYQISYSYPGPDGAEQTHKRRVRRVDYVMANTGQKLQVFYNPRWPRQHVLYQYSDYAPWEWGG